MKGLAEIASDNAADVLSRVTDPRIHCVACDGTGKRRLSEIQRDTLASVDESWTKTTAVLANLDVEVKPSALVNRLNDLVAFGLLERRRTGRHIEWRRT